ncbi:MAG TPA: hypothetical protein VE915_07945 [Actinomycetota bacterium]|jgi:hypothetical protein|nr:hypothetical protein [Actinomycetota bacterium]
MVLAVAITVGAAGLVVLVVMLISLFRQSMRLAGAVTDFQRAVGPVLEEIRAESGRAQSRLARLSERRTPRSSAKPRRG